jgi:hypothetical protein
LLTPFGRGDWQDAYVLKTELLFRKAVPEDVVPSSGLAPLFENAKDSTARWHWWQTDRFEIVAHTFGGKVDCVRISPKAGEHVFFPQEEQALAKACGVDFKDAELGGNRSATNGITVQLESPENSGAILEVYT